MCELCDLSSNKARMKSKQEKASHSEINQNTSTITEQVQKAITKSTGQSRNPKLLRKARHTQPLDALGLRCEIDGKRQTPGGQRLQTSQTGLKHTPVTEKDVEKCKSKLRKQANKWIEKLRGLVRLSGCNSR